MKAKPRGARIKPQTIAAMKAANEKGLRLGNEIIEACKGPDGRINSADAIAALLSASAALVAVTAGMRHLALPGSTSEFAPHGLAVLAELRKDIEANMTERTVQ